MTNTQALTKKDFKSDQDVRWCPGCGDYGILNSVQTAFANLGKKLENTVVISGIGCSSRFPYYMDSYGFHTIHGRALSIATGSKLANPDLDIWVITGDGDCLSIGGNHLIHALRRNVGLKVLMFNNRIYGLTKGQYSPTSDAGQMTKSSPLGSIDRPFRPINLALGAGATFVARSVDIYQKHLVQMIEKADAHEGTALVEIYQNCHIFNDGVYKDFTEKSVRDDRNLYLEHGKPLLFGANRQKGLILDKHLQPEVVTLGEGGITESDILVWNENEASPAMATALSSMSEADSPVPVGVFRNIAMPSFESLVHDQIQRAESSKTETLDDVLEGRETWVVEGDK